MGKQIGKADGKNPRFYQENLGQWKRSGNLNYSNSALNCFVIKRSYKEGASLEMR